ncbi:MAG: tRNA (adenosine(37)-N6)-threonylcarbamoyltransferase complex ATPase subunit type 1 TsaE [Zetaproteobacteria bacterium]|nr:MAG: tRNA (adenosine(37)-N6)-threonylcarbamoyltransferase complex ATPase subunit type 1 TsaE [Zetaproteobacteria bacterium]
MLEDEAATLRAARELAARLQPGDVVALSGPLGVGKSCFARAMLRALGVRDAALPSPTYAIIQPYRGAHGPVAHMDWYRIDDEAELRLTGVAEYLVAPWITLVEWPERGMGLLPAAYWRVELAIPADAPGSRRMVLAPPAWQGSPKSPTGSPESG